MGDVDVLTQRVSRVEEDNVTIKQTTRDLESRVVSVATDGAVMKTQMENLTHAVEGLGKKFDKLYYFGIGAFVITWLSDWFKALIKLIPS